MKKVHIYHHNDHDGIVAAGVLYNDMIKRKFATDDQIIFNMIDYDKELNFDHINFENDDQVWFLDYSFSNKINTDRFEDLLNKQKEIGSGSIFWIDHHLSSVNLYKSRFADYDIPGIRNSALCGASWTYLYCCGLYDKEVDKYTNRAMSSLFHNSLEVPVFLKLIDDYDCWKQKYKVTNDFHYGLLLSDPKDPYIKKMLDPDETDVSDIVAQGKAIQKYLNFNDREYHVNMYGFEFTLPEEHGGIKCFCLNRKGNSLMFGDKIDEYDAVIPFFYINGVWKYSIFTNKEYINCEQIAKSYGGGGHARAAGWITKELIFK